jgi:riboflavin kinase/FMN adenylyltransferase
MTYPALQIPESVRSNCVAIGNFDGVHRGHVELLNGLRALADSSHCAAVVVTFDPHPIAVLRPEVGPPVLTTNAERQRLLRAAGADHVVVLPVTRELLAMSAEEFFADVLVQQFQARGIVEGPNFRFGRDRQGDVVLLRQLCQLARITCRIVEPLDDTGEMISSSRIRTLLCQRALSDAVDLLGHPYRLTGVVRQGARRGSLLGFPTANLGEVVTLLPSHGVYAGRAAIGDDTFPAAVSIGPNPTFGEQREKVECHLDGFTGDLYGQTLHVDLLAELRPLRPFGSVDQLVGQITEDVQACRQIARGTASVRRSRD